MVHETIIHGGPYTVAKIPYFVLIEMQVDRHDRTLLNYYELWLWS